MMPVAAYNLLQSISLLAAEADNFRLQCIDGIEATERGSQLVERGLAICTALAPVIGYDAAAAIAKEAAGTGEDGAGGRPPQDRPGRGRPRPDPGPRGHDRTRLQRRGRRRVAPPSAFGRIGSAYDTDDTRPPALARTRPQPFSPFRSALMSAAETVLTVDDLHVEVEGKQILNGVSLSVPRGEIHAVMGPNGSGKSTFANTLMGHPRYVVTHGSIVFKGKEVISVLPEDRSRSGMFLASQYPTEIAGVTLINFLRQMVNARREDEMPLVDFRRMVNERMDAIGMDRNFAVRYVNQGFSGGEKKRSEILQMAILEPELAILDETDSGLDIDALRIVSDGINSVIHPGMAVLLITHYTRILNYVQPDVVHVMMDGQIVPLRGEGPSGQP